MIKFFRTIRKELVEKNNNGKYLKYAIGEIVLVVIGILVALQINNWNETRKERVKETAVLKQLRTEFKSNLAQLDQKINSKKDIINSVKKLFLYIDDPSLRIKDSVDYHLARLIPFSTFDPIVNDLASSGSLRIIQNDSLKQMLSFWTSEIKDVQEEENSWKYYRNESYVPFLIEHYQLRTIRNKALKSNLLGKYTIGLEGIKASENIEDIGNTYHPEDFNSLLDQPDFEDHITRCHSINVFAISQSKILRRRIVGILDILNDELSE